MTQHTRGGDESSEARRPNRLAKESSPYLLQHAYNPVEWWPWGPAAFEEARRRDVPILLSVGYSTCYWCHVMERECFESEEIAREMNQRFVCIKLDREERPDVDDIYMNALLVTRGSGGWPMNVFLEPAGLRPIWCGTYFPPQQRGNMPGWTQVLEGIADAWKTRRQEVLAQAEQIAQAVTENLSAATLPAVVGEAQISQALQQLLSTFDKINGGFGGAPKFPQPAYLEFLLDVRRAAADDQTADAIDLCVKKTLDSMLSGGIFDQIGGGFHRYSVDQSWTVPHFEKMLYDNAQLASVYARAATKYADQEYARVARATIDYVLRELADEHGGFWSAQDAEVDGREGLNYVWTPPELRAALGAGVGTPSGQPAEAEADAALALKVYGLDAGPNFQDPHHPHEAPVNVLRLADRLDRLASPLNVQVDSLRERLAGINRRLLTARNRREHPHTDDKVLASWNGLMLSALARASEALDEPRYLAAGSRAAMFLLREMVDERGVLRRAWRRGVMGGPGFLEDSGMVIQGLVDMARAVQRAGQDAGELIAGAERLATHAMKDFADRRDGRLRYCDTRAGEADLFVRTSSMHDGVIPSGPSAMAHALLDLAAATGSVVWRREAGELLVSLSGAIAQSPVGSINATRALARALTDERFKGLMSDFVAAESADPAQAGAWSTPPGQSLAPVTTSKTGSREPLLAVEIYAAVDRVTVGEQTPAEFTLVLKIADGHHVIAADPGGGGEGLVPMRVGIVHGSGVVAYADYPDGEPYREALRVYKGTIELPVVLERVGAWKGRPLVAMTYQACTDTECLLPVTVELDVAVEKG